MKYNSLEKNLKHRLETAIVDVTPGVVVRAYHYGRLICDLEVGQTFPIYDLASLTKVIFTQQAMMAAFDAGHWNLNTTVQEILPRFKFDKIKIRDLLTHTSGLDWWRPFYKDMPQDQNLEMRREWLFQQINATELAQPTGSKALYSDLGFMTLGFILERFYQKDLYDVWKQTFEDFYSTTALDFHLYNQPVENINLYAPTEECSHRNKLLRGEVHDENCWAMGGVSTHAGLFGSIDDVAAFGLNVRSQMNGIARYKIKQKTAQYFAQRALHQDVGDWALGYMLPSAENASCGPLFSPSSIGHTGFTGTSFWYDPKQDLLVVVLSNRVNYTRENKRFIALRPQIHTWIYESTVRK